MSLYPTPTPDPFLILTSTVPLQPDYIPVPAYFTYPTPTASPTSPPDCGPFTNSLYPSFSYLISSSTVTFINTTISNTKISGYNWDFADGFTGYVKNPTHKYATPGTYNVNLTEMTITGLTASFTQSLTI